MLYDIRLKEISFFITEDLSMTLRIVMEESFYAHGGPGLMYSKDFDALMDVQVKKTSIVGDVLDKLSEELKKPVEELRVWPMELRDNGTYRPTYQYQWNDRNGIIKEMLKLKSIIESAISL